MNAEGKIPAHIIGEIAKAVGVFPVSGIGKVVARKAQVELRFFEFPTSARANRKQHVGIRCVGKVKVIRVLSN